MTLANFIKALNWFLTSIFGESGYRPLFLQHIEFPSTENNNTLIISFSEKEDIDSVDYYFECSINENDLNDIPDSEINYYTMDDPLDSISMEIPITEAVKFSHALNCCLDNLVQDINCNDTINLISYKVINKDNMPEFSNPTVSFNLAIEGSSKYNITVYTDTIITMLGAKTELNE